MNTIILSLCLVLPSVDLSGGSPDTLWTVDFSSQPTGWIAGPYWEYTGESYYLGNENSASVSIFWEGGRWWMLGASGDRIYKYLGVK